MVRRAAAWSGTRERAGAVATSSGAVVPLGGAAVEITGGLLADWQWRNREATLAHTVAALRSAGNLENLRRLLPAAAGTRRAPYQGRYPFLDTDLYKCLEGVAYQLAGPEEDEGELRAFYEEAVELLERVQAPDGYLNSFYQAPDSPRQPWSDLAWGHELYTLGHLIQAAVAAHRRLGDRRLLDVVVRFADLVVSRYGEGGQEAVCGHPEVEMALVELCRETGNQAYLTLARLFVDRRGRGTLEHRIFPPDYFQDHVPLRQLPSVTGHAVRMMYLAAGACDVHLETGDPTLLTALERLWDDMVARKLYFTGGLGSRHSDEAIGDGYELPSERSYSETCAAIGTMQWAWRMFLATGRATYLDVFERVLYNAFAVGLSADGRSFFYDNPLQRRADHEQRSGAESGGEPLRRAWFGCACCPPNIVRWMAQLSDYLTAERDGELLIAGYAGARVDGRDITLAMDTEYPWDGEVRMTIERAPRGRYRITLRIPGWCDATGVRVRVNAETVDSAPEDGWLTVDRQWEPGDEVRIGLPMPVRAHGSHPHLDATRGAVAVARGPLVYCVEQQDCAACVDDVVIGAADVAIARAERCAEPGSALRGAVLLHTGARAAATGPAELYPVLRPDQEKAAPQAESVPLTLVPYFLWGNREPGPMRVWIRGV